MEIKHTAIDTATATSVVEKDKIVYHISVTMEANELYLQLIIVDRYGYDEDSTRLMGHLRKVLLDKIFKSKCDLMMAVPGSINHFS